ncbi:hypothetical protein MC885_006196 [Smutsia gigantea]|nr:hypothetical protein MC885_006196 [Smutsia gigantea]
MARPAGERTGRVTRTLASSFCTCFFPPRRAACSASSSRACSSRTVCSSVFFIRSRRPVFWEEAEPQSRPAGAAPHIPVCPQPHL